MNIFLTGGTGFIGSHILMKLIHEGHSVTVLARNPNKIPVLQEYKEVTLIQGDMENIALIKKNLHEIDVVIHVALNYNDQSAESMLRSDTLPSVILADLAGQSGVGEIIYTSSTAVNDVVYMSDLCQEDVFEMTKQNPVTFYGATKAATENYLLAAEYQYGMKINFVRPGYVFGNPAVEGAPTQADPRFKNIVEAAIANQQIEVSSKNDGTQFIDADDLAELYIQILNSEYSRKTYLGLSKNFVSWYQIAQWAIEICQSKSKIKITGPEPSQKPILFDVQAIQRDFGLEFSNEEKIKKHLNYYKSQLA